MRTQSRRFLAMMAFAFSTRWTHHTWTLSFAQVQLRTLKHRTGVSLSSRRVSSRTPLTEKESFSQPLGRRGMYHHRRLCSHSDNIAFNCASCGQNFTSRNSLFRHLRLLPTGCGAALAAFEGKDTKTADLPQAQAQPKTKKVPRMRKRYQNTLLTESSCALCFMDIPLDIATTKKLGNVFWKLMPASMPQPFIKHIVRKGYRQNKSSEEGSGMKSAWLAYAFVAFRDSAEAAEVQQAIDGREVLDGRWKIRILPAQGDWLNENRTRPMLAPGEHPTLGDQLFPRLLTGSQRTAALVRHAAVAGVSPPGSGDDDRPIKASIKSYYRKHPRNEVKVAGHPLPRSLVEAATAELSKMRWPPVHHRNGMQAAQYLVIYNGKRNEGYEELSKICQAILDWAAPEYPCAMVAVTKSFSGSPHVDASDVRPQFAISLGDFEDGGELCVEGIGRPDMVWVVDTKNKIALVEGRSVHWVRGFRGERYSLIFYATEPAYHTAPLKAFDGSWIPNGHFATDEVL